MTYGLGIKLKYYSKNFQVNCWSCKNYSKQFKFSWNTKLTTMNIFLTCLYILVVDPWDHLIWLYHFHILLGIWCHLQSQNYASENNFIKYSKWIILPIEIKSKFHKTFILQEQTSIQKFTLYNFSIEVILFLLKIFLSHNLHL